MKYWWWLLMFVILPTLAFGQSNGGFIGPSGAVYPVRYACSDAATTKACLFAVNNAVTPIVAIDKNGDGKIDSTDAIACSTGTIVTDGVTANVLTVTVSPPLTADTPVAMMGFPATGDAHPSSPLSNWKSLAAALKAPVILN